MSAQPVREITTFSAGCFWYVEEVFRPLGGVISTRVGYSGGRIKNPTYEDVCAHTTGHAEVAEVTFDPDKISYKDLLKKFWESHDPTQVNRQGPDIGDQYRSSIFFHSPEQQRLAEESKGKEELSGRHHGPLATQIVPATEFYEAEEYHQKYLAKRGLSTCSI